VRAVKFVGSTAGGKRVAELCGQSMKKGAFELGGSDPFIVFKDADIDLATTKAIVGRMHTNGQACNNSKRFIIHNDVYDTFMTELLKKLDRYVNIGDPMNP
jgi:succinate-semialdehyde dehydrogenase/glutarate-semialdehyde dehydrogenase